MICIIIELQLFENIAARLKSICLKKLSRIIDSIFITENI